MIPIVQRIDDSKSPGPLDPQCVVIHNTANTGPASAECKYSQTPYSITRNNVCVHYWVDEREAIQAMSLTAAAVHAGDRWSKLGSGNRTGIAIEICRSLFDDNDPAKQTQREQFAQAERNGAWLAAKLLSERGWGIDRLKKHQDFSGKYCPHKTLDWGWARFVAMVQAEMCNPTPAPTRDPKEDNDMLRRGDKGTPVKEWQASLIAVGFPVEGGADSSYGPATEAVTKAFQAANRLTADGIVGPLTNATMLLALRNRIGGSVDQADLESALIALGKAQDQVKAKQAMIDAARVAIAQAAAALG